MRLPRQRTLGLRCEVLRDEFRDARRTPSRLQFLNPSGDIHAHAVRGDRRRAARCYLSAADKARARYANEAAVDLYGRGLEMLEDDDALARLEALHNLGDVLDRVGKLEEAKECFSRKLQTGWLYTLPFMSTSDSPRIRETLPMMREAVSFAEYYRRADVTTGRNGPSTGKTKQNSISTTLVFEPRLGIIRHFRPGTLPSHHGPFSPRIRF